MKRALAVLFLALAAAFGAQATMVNSLFLDELIDGAAIAFQGTCTENRTQRDANGIIATYTTFAVSDVLKGAVGSSHTIKQIGGAIPGENVQFKVYGVPTFAVGQGYVVFLAGVSASGFSSPVGLTQGRFTIAQDAGGPQVTNGRDFVELTSRMAPGAAARAPQGSGAQNGPQTRLNLQDFKALIRERVGAGP
ncbi:MAG: hypothetical protein ABI789_10850 [Usitatibacter sp.]